MGQGDRTNRPVAEVKPQLRQSLQRLGVQQARQQYQASLRENANVTILLRPPKVEVSYRCGAAARRQGRVRHHHRILGLPVSLLPHHRGDSEQLQAKCGAKVSLAFRDFPLRSLHPQAQPAAEGARCAGAQSKFWEYHDLVFQNQTDLGPDIYPRFAETAKLDIAQFRACVSAGKCKPQIEDEVRDGARIGLSGTPVLFINGAFLNSAAPATAFEKLIGQELAGQGTVNRAPPQESVGAK